MAKDKPQKLFCVFNDELKQAVDLLSDEQAGGLLKALLEYNTTKEETTITDLPVRLLFMQFKAQLDRWDETREKRSAAGKKGMAERWNKNDGYGNACYSNSETKDTKCITKNNTSITNDNKAITNDSTNTITNTITNTNTNKRTLSGKPDDIAEVIEHLNNLTGRHYRSTGANAELIRARLNEGYSVAQCMKVIDNMCGHWSGDKKMAQYLRPETLFRRSHMESYLNNTAPQIPNYFPEDENLEF